MQPRNTDLLYRPSDVVLTLHCFIKDNFPHCTSTIKPIKEEKNPSLTASCHYHEVIWGKIEKRTIIVWPISLENPSGNLLSFEQAFKYFSLHIENSPSDVQYLFPVVLPAGIKASLGFDTHIVLVTVENDKAKIYDPQRRIAHWYRWRAQSQLEGLLRLSTSNTQKNASEQKRTVEYIYTGLQATTDRTSCGPYVVWMMLHFLIAKHHEDAISINTNATKENPADISDKTDNPPHISAKLIEKNFASLPQEENIEVSIEALRDSQKMYINAYHTYKKYLAPEIQSSFNFCGEETFDLTNVLLLDDEDEPEQTTTIPLPSVISEAKEIGQEKAYRKVFLLGKELVDSEKKFVETAKYVIARLEEETESTSFYWKLHSFGQNELKYVLKQYRDLISDEKDKPSPKEDGLEPPLQSSALLKKGDELEQHAHSSTSLKEQDNLDHLPQPSTSLKEEDNLEQLVKSNPPLTLNAGNIGNFTLACNKWITKFNGRWQSCLLLSRSYTENLTLSEKHSLNLSSQLSAPFQRLPRIKMMLSAMLETLTSIEAKTATPAEKLGNSSKDNRVPAKVYENGENKFETNHQGMAFAEAPAHIQNVQKAFNRIAKLAGIFQLILPVNSFVATSLPQKETPCSVKNSPIPLAQQAKEDKNFTNPPILIEKKQVAATKPLPPEITHSEKGVLIEINTPPSLPLSPSSTQEIEINQKIEPKETPSEKIPLEEKTIAIPTENAKEPVENMQESKDVCHSRENDSSINQDAQASADLPKPFIIIPLENREQCNEKNSLPKPVDNNQNVNLAPEKTPPQISPLPPLSIKPQKLEPPPLPPYADNKNHLMGDDIQYPLQNNTLPIISSSPSTFSRPSNEKNRSQKPLTSTTFIQTKSSNNHSPGPHPKSTPTNHEVLPPFPLGLPFRYMICFFQWLYYTVRDCAPYLFSPSKSQPALTNKVLPDLIEKEASQPNKVVKDEEGNISQSSSTLIHFGRF